MKNKAHNIFVKINGEHRVKHYQIYHIIKHKIFDINKLINIMWNM